MAFRWYRVLVPAVLLLLQVTVASATTRRVPSEYPTIQAGVDAAAIGDTVLVAPGTYTDDGNYNIDFNGKDIVLLSEAGAEETVIDAEGSLWPNITRRVFYLTSGETSAARIDGFTITGGRTYGNPDFAFGGGMRCEGASPTIANCVIRDNRSGAGGSSSPNKDNTQHMGCGAGGGLFIAATPSPMRILNCRIEANSANCQGPAIVVWDADDVVFDGCVIAQNEDMGIQVGQAATCAFINCTIANTSGFDGSGYGIAAGPDVDILLDRCVVWGNCRGVTIWSGAMVQSVCSVIDSSSVWGSGDITYVGSSFFSDPLFCDPSAACVWPPSSAVGDYRVQTTSLCLPENNPCGALIGALGSCQSATGVPSGGYRPEDAIWASPNPFSTGTSLSLTSALERDATLNVFDVAGRRVREFRMTRSAAPVMWNGADENGQRVAPGTYLLRLEGRQTMAGRVTIVR